MRPIDDGSRRGALSPPGLGRKTAGPKNRQKISPKRVIFHDIIRNLSPTMMRASPSCKRLLERYIHNCGLGESAMPSCAITRAMPVLHPTARYSRLTRAVGFRDRCVVYTCDAMPVYNTEASFIPEHRPTRAFRAHENGPTLPVLHRSEKDPPTLKLVGSPNIGASTCHAPPPSSAFSSSCLGSD